MCPVGACCNLPPTLILLHRKLCQPQSAGGLPGDAAATSPPREHGSSVSPPQVGAVGMGMTTWRCWCLRRRREEWAQPEPSGPDPVLVLGSLLSSGLKAGTFSPTNEQPSGFPRREGPGPRTWACFPWTPSSSVAKGGQALDCPEPRALLPPGPVVSEILRAGCRTAWHRVGPCEQGLHGAALTWL